MEKINNNVLFEGIHVAQTEKIQLYFEDLVNKFDRIIEIGTYNGGLTLYIHRNKKEEIELISYDINESFNQVPKSNNIDFRIGDCFSEQTKTEIINLISDNTKKVLLLCDGGKKNEEFNLFSKFLKKDDVIMLHDYMHSVEDYKDITTNLGWNYASESSYDKISNAVIRNGLTEYHYDDFKSVLWGAFIKK